MALSHSAARAYYDRFGARQDTQAFYEDPCVDRLIAHGEFESAASVCEFGCGTGRLAERLLKDRLPPAATYLAVDQSPVMVGLARSRLAPFAARVTVRLTDGSVRFPTPDASLDRVISTYVLDLLSEDDIRGYLDEARRTLRTDGRLCLAGLTAGVRIFPRVISAVWTAVYKMRPALVGGCRPLRLADFFPTAEWTIRHREVVTPLGVPSELLVATPRRG